MLRLRNGVQRYDWGSVDAIPQFLGVTPEGGPVAEMWIGTHPLLPSQVVDGVGGSRPLSDVVGDLPFMVKLLAAERPLSIQVHPSLAQAEAGFEAEEAAGIPIDAPTRVYRDANHKPEMVYALSTFDSLIGFRPTAEIIRVLSPLGTSLTRQMSEELRSDPGFAGIVRRLEWLLSRETSPKEIQEVVDACRRLSALGLDVKRAYATAVELSEFYPDDVGVIVSLLLNRMTLQPGEAAFLETGVIHAHLRGLCIEVMANSDNVLRAGLTSKHIDAGGLVACLDKGLARVARVTPERQTGDTDLFSPAGVEFALAVTQVSEADVDGLPLPFSGASVIVCTGGEVMISGAEGPLVLRRGESLLTAEADGQLVLTGLGEVVQAHSPLARTLRSRLIDLI